MTRQTSHNGWKNEKTVSAPHSKYTEQSDENFKRYLSFKKRKEKAFDERQKSYSFQ